MFTNTRIYNYFTSNQTQSYQVNKKKSTNFVDTRYHNIKIITNKGDESITEEYSPRSNNSLSDKLKASGIDDSQILKIMKFANEELSEICNPLIANRLPDTHKLIVGDSSDANLEIIVKNETLTTPEVEVKISNIQSRIFIKPFNFFKPLYIFNEQITYNPKTDTCASISELTSEQAPSIISQLIAKVLSHLAVIFRLKDTL